MPLSPDDAVKRAQQLYELQQSERTVLDGVRRYWKGRQALPYTIPTRGTTPQIRALARMARVNTIEIVVESLAQSLFVEGFRGKKDPDNIKVWEVWQDNRMDARQSGVHRAAVAYGVAYVIVLPGDPVPVIRGVSPRNLTAAYGGDPDWPVDALERRSASEFRLYDDGSIYTLTFNGSKFELVGSVEHGMKVTPVVRYLEAEDLDREDDALDELLVARNSSKRLNTGQVAPLMTLQDQIDETTFELLVAQHYASFRQRVITGWAPKDETEALEASVRRVWTFEDENVKTSEFDQTDTSNFLKSRDASLRHAATLSQTPVHELIGEMVNLSAEALVAAEAGRDRKVADRQTLIGESHEQMFDLVGRLIDVNVPSDAEVIWRVTSARSFAAVVDGLGKLATLLGIPAEELWELVPGATQQDVQRWRAAKKAEDAASPPNEPPPATGDSTVTLPDPNGSPIGLQAR